MHASGQWSALGTLLGGGTVVLYAEPHVDMERVLDLVERERVGLLNLVGDAGARPLVEALEAAARPLGPLVAAAARLGRQHAVGRREGAAARRAAVGARDPRGDGLDRVARAGGRGVDAVAARRRRRARRSRRRPRRSWSTTTCGRCRRDAGSSAGSRRAAGCRSATTTTTSAARARSSTIDGARYVAARATWRPSTPTAPCTSRARARRASTPAARRCTPKRSRRRCSTHPRVRRRDRRRCPRRALRRAWWPRSSPCDGAPIELDELRAHCRGHARRLQGAARAHGRRHGASFPGGQARSRVGDAGPRRSSVLPGHARSGLTRRRRVARLAIDGLDRFWDQVPPLRMPMRSGRSDEGPNVTSRLSPATGLVLVAPLGRIPAATSPRSRGIDASRRDTGRCGCRRPR